MNKRLFQCATAAMLGLGLAGLLLLLFAVAPARAAANIHCVNQSGTGCDAVCGGGCYSSVQTAVDSASPGDQVRIAGGTYTDPSGTVAAITKHLEVSGGYGQSCGDADFDPDLQQTVLDAQWSGSVISVTNAEDVLLMHLTLTHGDGSDNCGSDGCGGGIYASATNLFVGHSFITHNVASKHNAMGLGGGIYANAPSHIVEVWETRVISNSGNTSPSSIYYSYGGGIFLKYGTAILRANEIRDNVSSSVGTGGYGGGVFLYGVSQADVLSNTIRGNVATAHQSSGEGGGIYILGFKALLSGNFIDSNRAAPNNWAGYGGGVYISNDSEVHLARNIITNNAAASQQTGLSAFGGGVVIASSDPVTLTNNLIARNFATDGDGGGLYLDHNSPAGPVFLFNNTITDNGDTAIVVRRYTDLTITNNAIAGHMEGITNTVTASSTVIADANLFWNISDPIVGNNAIQQNPQFTFDYHLHQGSPAVDAGMNIPWLTVDLDGNPRPLGPNFDIGAFEGVRWDVFLPLVMRN